jgi:hypothetical protein
MVYWGGGGGGEYGTVVVKVKDGGEIVFNYI